MSIYDRDILKLIADNPKIRMPEICDLVGCEGRHVQLATEKLVREGHIIETPALGANDRLVSSYRFAPDSEQAAKYRTPEPETQSGAKEAPVQKEKNAPARQVHSQPARKAERPFECAIWSTGALTLVKGGQQLHLDTAEVDQVFEMLGRVRVAAG